MSKANSNSRRFVNAAWALLTFQVVASAGAVGVTGWALLDVQHRLARIELARAEPATTDDAAQASETTLGPAGDSPAAPRSTTAATPADVRCERVGDNYVRVQAAVRWCDTGIALNENQTVLVRDVRGLWSNEGEPRYGAAGIRGTPWDGTIVANADLASLVGRVGGTAFPVGGASSFTSPAQGALFLSMNDTDRFDDNQGYLDVYLVTPQFQ